MQLPTHRLVAVACGVLVLAVAACSRGDDGSGASLAANSVEPNLQAVPTSAGSPTSPATMLPLDVDGTPTTEPSARPVGSSPVSVVEVAEVGVPGLDSADAFCAAWSRFAGSFQVVAVTAAFGSGPPERLASLEVAAAPVVTMAYDDLLANWPDELSSEFDLVADDFLGPFARRLAVARGSLDAVAAGASTIATIADAWITGLGQRDPSTPEFAVDLPDTAWAVIDEAAAHFASQLVPFNADPSLVTNVHTPLTSEYLAVSCPDQGTLSGQEVDAG